jgi:uncharacterized protein (TIGR02118 family)
MVKIVFCLKRLPHLSRAEFQAYWRERHAPLVAARARLLGIRRYVQSHTTDDADFAGPARARGGAAPYDGVAEIWFDDSAEGTPEARRAAALELLADERRFIDLAASPLFYTQEHEVLRNEFGAQHGL